MKFLSDRRTFLLGAALGAPAIAVAYHVVIGNGSSAFALPSLPQDQDDTKQAVNVFAYMAPEEVADVRSGTPRRDVTAACQAALNTGKNVFFPNGVYLLDPDPEHCLKTTSNQKITFENNAVLKAKGTRLDLYSVFRIEGRENVTVEGGTIVGERESHIGSGGESGMGIAVYNSSRVLIRGVTVRDCWGDGIYVGGRGLTGTSADIVVENCVCENNRRQGLTIAAVKRCRVTGGRFVRTNGTPPSAGIDIEPNHTVVAGIPMSKAPVSDVLIEGVDCSDNEGPGIAASQVHTSNVRIVRVTTHRNRGSGIACGYVGRDVQIISASAQDNSEHGISIFGDPAYITKNINVENAVCRGNGQNGVAIGFNVDGFSIMGGSVSHNGQHGISCDGTGGSVCDNGLVREVFIHSNSQNSNAAFDNVFVGPLCHDLQIVGNNCKTGAEENKPRYGVHVSVNEPNLITNNDLVSGGVVANAHGQSNPKVVWRDNAGLEPRTTT